MASAGVTMASPVFWVVLVCAMVIEFTGDVRV